MGTGDGARCTSPRASLGGVANGLLPGWYGVLGAGGCTGVLKQGAGGLEIRALAQQTAASWVGCLWAG